MSVRPTAFRPTECDVWHDEMNHGGVVALADVRFSKARDGSDIDQFIEIDCPVPGCGSVSTWPVGGGADAHIGQALHILKLVQANGLPFAAAKARVKAAAIAMDGPDRFKLDRHTRAEIESGKPLDRDKG